MTKKEDELLEEALQTPKVVYHSTILGSDSFFLKKKTAIFFTKALMIARKLKGNAEDYIQTIDVDPTEDQIKTARVWVKLVDGKWIEALP